MHDISTGSRNIGPVGGRVRRAEPGGAEGNQDGDMVGSSGKKRGVPSAESWGQMRVGKGQVKDRRPRRLCEGEVSIDPWLVEERKFMVRCEGEVWV